MASAKQTRRAAPPDPDEAEESAFEPRLLWEQWQRALPALPLELSRESLTILRDAFFRASAEMLRGFAAVAELEAARRPAAQNGRRRPSPARSQRDEGTGRSGRGRRRERPAPSVEKVDL